MSCLAMWKHMEAMTYSLAFLWLPSELMVRWRLLGRKQTGGAAGTQEHDTGA
jgi:hypothetical protein